MLLRLFSKIFIMETGSGILNKEINRKKRSEKTLGIWFCLWDTFISRKILEVFVEMTSISSTPL